MVPILVAHVKVLAHVAEEVPVTEFARVDYRADPSRYKHRKLIFGPALKSSGRLYPETC